MYIKWIVNLTSRKIESSRYYKYAKKIDKKSSSKCVELGSKT